MPDESTAGGGARGGGSTEPLAWLDRIKALALLWIVLNHVVERIFGYPHIANPGAGWPPLAERVAQLRPLEVAGPWDLPVNLLRTLGWFGDQGVQLFLIASGFGLAWGLLARDAPARLSPVDFYRRRAARLLPLWWGAHLVFLAGWAVTGWGPSPGDPAFWASLAGVRITPGQLYYFCPAWWFVGLLIQLYLVFPWLWGVLRRRGPFWLLSVVGGAALAVRGAGLLFFDGYLDAWSRGAIFVTRLPEFLLGMCLAFWLHRRRDAATARLRSPAALLLAAAAWGLGTLLSLSLLGMTVAPLLLGAGAFLLLHAVVRRRPGGVLVLLGRASYPLYLVHQVPILLLVPEAASGLRATVPAVLLALGLTALGAVLLEWIVAASRGLLAAGGRRWGPLPTALAVLAAAGLAAGALIGAELLVRSADPQEVFGWGERPALEPHPEFGWRLRPSRTTRLRWEGYDYRATANSLGFPGPDPTEDPPTGTTRIVVTGDAFSSAEGVDTAQAWPRLLEEALEAGPAGHRVEVLNFAVTGYGPRQEAAVLDRFLPEVGADLVIVELFVNDFEDVLVSDEAFRGFIGFDRPPREGWRSVLSRAHLRRWLQLRVFEPLLELVQGSPRPQGWFLGNFASLERGDTAERLEAERLVLEALARIRDRAASVGAAVVVVMVPAPVQICGPADLSYYPRGVDLDDAGRFDRERPQRIARHIAERLGLAFLDLRDALRGAGSCPYQRHNMHWTAEGHRLAASAVAEFLARSGYLAAAEVE